MNTETKVIIAVIAFLGSALWLCIHSEVRSKQLLLQEVGIEATYFQALGINDDYIHGYVAGMNKSFDFNHED
jgi:hypothetical protein